MIPILCIPKQEDSQFAEGVDLPGSKSKSSLEFDSANQ